MNAPARILDQVRRGRRRESYIPIVHAHMPGCEGKELDLRCGMLLMRDYAGAKLRWTTEEPGYILEHVQRLATAHALRSMSLDELQSIHHALIRLGTVATDLGTLFPAAPAEAGDARE